MFIGRVAEKEKEDLLNYEKRVLYLRVDEDRIL
jgi:hypothetical protein